MMAAWVTKTFTAMAILLLGEQPRLFHLVGYALVLAGVVGVMIAG